MTEQPIDQPGVQNGGDKDKASSEQPKTEIKKPDIKPENNTEMNREIDKLEAKIEEFNKRREQIEIIRKAIKKGEISHEDGAEILSSSSSSEIPLEKQEFVPYKQEDAKKLADTIGELLGVSYTKKGEEEKESARKTQLKELREQIITAKKMGIISPEDALKIYFGVCPSTSHNSIL